MAARCSGPAAGRVKPAGAFRGETTVHKVQALHPAALPDSIRSEVVLHMARLTIMGPEGRAEADQLPHNTLGRYPNNNAKLVAK